MFREASAEASRSGSGLGKWPPVLRVLGTKSHQPLRQFLRWCLMTREGLTLRGRKLGGNWGILCFSSTCKVPIWKSSLGQVQRKLSSCSLGWAQMCVWSATHLPDSAAVKAADSTAFSSPATHMRTPSCSPALGEQLVFRRQRASPIEAWMCLS